MSRSLDVTIGAVAAQKKASEERVGTQVAAQTGQQTTFKKAMGTCLQGRGYTTR